MNQTELKSTNNYDNILLDTPFRILGHNDSTVWQKMRYRDGNWGLVIYFHDLKRWINPPTDTTMEWQAQKNIDKYGIEYLAEGEEL